MFLSQNGQRVTCPSRGQLAVLVTMLNYGKLEMMVSTANAYTSVIGNSSNVCTRRSRINAKQNLEGTLATKRSGLQKVEMDETEY